MGGRARSAPPSEYLTNILRLANIAHSKDALAATNNFTMAIWRKVPDFRRAIAHMLSSGESEKDNDPDLYNLLQEYKRIHGEFFSM